MRLPIRWRLVLFALLPAATVSVAFGILTGLGPRGEEPAFRAVWTVLILFFLLAVLLRSAGQRMGRSVSRVEAALQQLAAGNFSVRVPSGPARDEIDDLAIAFNTTAGELALRIDEFTRATAAGEEFEGELRAARKIQASLLPKQFPDDTRFRLFGVNAPAEHVGGDFFDFLVTEEGQLVLVIADVSGKGIAAAILMAVSKTIVRNLAITGLDPGEILEEANRLLVANQIGTMYVTLFVARYDPDSGRYSYANGGHLPPLHVSAEARVSSVGAATGTLVGIFPGIEFGQGSGCLEKGELLVLYTDGVTEARSPAGTFYGDRPVTRLLSAYSDAPPHFLCDLIVREVNAFRGGESADDLTLLMLRRSV